MTYINRLESYKTAIKNLHWSSNNMSEHKLLDDIASALSDYQDDLAEAAQGIYGKIKVNELRPKKYNITNSKKMINDLLSDTKNFHSSTKSKELIGLRSVVENFIAELNQFSYLMDFCLKEDIKRNLTNNKKNIKEHKSLNISENELRSAIREACSKVLGDNKNKIVENKTLNESCWYGNLKPFKAIQNAAFQIMKNFEYVNNEDYEPDDDCDGRDLSYDIYQWAKRIEEEADRWITKNSDNTPINGGENW